MGITIHYEGISKKDNEARIIQHVEKFAREHSWPFGREGNHSITVEPHPDSEPLGIRLDGKRKFSGFIKTGLAPFEIHRQVIHLFGEIKPYLSKLSVEDESGYWLEYQEKNAKPKARELTRFPTLSEADLVRAGSLKLPEHAVKLDRDFWNANPSYVAPFMHVPAVRDRLGADLRVGGFVLTAKDMEPILTSEGFWIRSEDWEDDVFYLINLAMLWAWRRATGTKDTDSKRNKCAAFAGALARGCHGFGGGFLNQTHRRAHIALDFLEENEGEVGPARSLEIMYSLFDFCGLKVSTGNG